MSKPKSMPQLKPRRLIPHTIKARLTAVAFVLVLVTVSASTSAVLSLYSNDKWSSTVDSERGLAERAADHIQGLAILARSASRDAVLDSRQLVFVVDQFCTAPIIHMSIAFQKQLDELGLKPEDWLSKLDRARVCGPTGSDTGPWLLSGGPDLPFPKVMLGFNAPGLSRVAMISMDGFSSRAGNTLFMVDPLGKVLWSADSGGYLEDAMEETQVSARLLSRGAQEAFRNQRSATVQSDHEGLLSFASAGTRWTIVSLSHIPTLMLPIYFAVLQACLLAASLFFICLWLGRRLSTLVTRPLLELRASADRIAAGDFDSRIALHGDDEIVAVKSAFNVMMERIKKLLQETRLKAALQQELEVAGKVQTMLLPAERVTAGTFRIFGKMEAASHCGGDWWGYLEIPKLMGGSPYLVLMVGDVEGHGTAQALITGGAQGAQGMLAPWLREQPERCEKPGDILTFFNEAIFSATKGTLTMTFAVAVIDRDAGKVYASNAGHPSPYLFSPQADGTMAVNSIRQAGVPLGQAPDSRYEQSADQPWSAGSQILMYSDGLIDCVQKDKVLFSRKELRRLLVELSAERGEKLFTKLLAERQRRIVGFVPNDDVTTVLCMEAPQ
jgi:serine phosphatase RsbU (regulator of sigma subunit)